MSSVEKSPSAAPRGLLVVAAAAVGFAAADTYVVVLALPDMMASVDLSIDQLQRGAPVVSGFLLGYVAMLPLIGRISDVRGRIPVLIGSLVAFCVGSLVTAGSYDLASMVIGRFLQGAGGGGLVPTTLALVADIWVVERRSVPLGVVGAVQEIGSVVGPLYGGLLLAQWTWRAIFWVNLAVGVLLIATLMWLRRRAPADASQPRTDLAPHDLTGAALGLSTLIALALVMTEPARLVSGLTTGLAFIRYGTDSRWSTPMAGAFAVLLLLFLLRQLTARRPLIGWRQWPEVVRSVDLPGAMLLAVSLAGVVLAFATADPEVQVLSAYGAWLLVASGIAAVGFVLRQRVAATPLVPTGALGQRAAWGSLVVSFFVGAALIAALVDVPVFARITVYPDSQLDAALILVRFLVAVPVGAVLGGYLTRYVAAALPAAGGMGLAAVAFVLMTRWEATSLLHAGVTLPLALGGLGFGLAIAPTNAALLAATRGAVHGLASALLVVARMVGMLVGISALTTIGLRRFYAVSDRQPSLRQTCHSDTLCDAYVEALRAAGIAQLHAVFWGAAICAAVAALLSAVLLRPQSGSVRRSTT